MSANEQEIGAAVERSISSRLGDLSRRAFLRRGALTAAAVGVVGSLPGASGLLAGASSEAPAVATVAAETEADVGPLSGPLVAHVTNLSTGEISLFQGTQEVVVRDPALARRLLSASRP